MAQHVKAQPISKCCARCSRAGRRRGRSSCGKCQGDVYTACRLAFPDKEADDVFVQVIEQLRADDFALLRAFDGRATISGYLRLVLRDVLSERVARLLSESPERGWRAFEHFFKRDMLRAIARYFPAAGQGDDDIYHDVVSALIEDNYRRILAYDGQGSFGGFVLRIVNNLCIDRLRKDIPRRRLPAAIARLPEAEQEVFRQLYWENCPEHQLGTALRARKVELGAEALAAAIAAVKAALPRNFSAGGEDDRPRLVALPGSTEEGGEAELPDERPDARGSRHRPPGRGNAGTGDRRAESGDCPPAPGNPALPAICDVRKRGIGRPRHRQADGAAGDRGLPAAATGRADAAPDPF